MDSEEKSEKQATPNLHRAGAAYYDLVTEVADVPFYYRYAAQQKDPILELACGTGRVTLALVQAGYNVWGIDLSREMLAQLEKKSGKLTSEQQRRLHILHGDMTAFDLGMQFSLIIIPFRGFQAITESSQQQGCLRSVRKHLAPGGLFIIDVFRPGRLDESWIAPESFDREVEDPETTLTIRVTDWRRRIDVERQVIYPELTYYVCQPDGSELKVSERLAMACFYEDQLRRLLVDNGFEIVEQWGDYNGTPIEEGPELIFVCR